MKRSVWTARRYLLPSFDMNIGNGALSKAHESRARSVRVSSSTKQAPTIRLGDAPSPLGLADKLCARNSCALIMFAIQRPPVIEPCPLPLPLETKTWTRQVVSGIA